MRKAHKSQAKPTSRVGIALLCLALAALCLADCVIGASDLGVRKSIAALLSPLGFNGTLFGSVSETESYIVLSLRLPRALFAVVSGAGLAICGLAFQALFRNPLSDPYILGVSSGASLGAAIAIVVGFEGFALGIGLSSFLTAILTVFLIIAIASYGNRIHTSTLLLAGVSINFLCSALISLLMVLNRDQTDKIIFWTMGSLSSIDYGDLGLCCVVVALGMLVVLFNARNLNAMLVDSMTAQTLGVNVERTKRILLVVCTLMVSVIVSCSGVIGFVGLIVPHIARLFVGADNRKLLPVSALGGGVFMLLGDLLSRSVIPPSEIPPGSITALIGAPFFIYLLFNSKKRLHG